MFDLSDAPFPEETTLIYDEVEYPMPALITFTSVIAPFEIIGLSFAPDPLFVGSITTKSGTE